MYLELAAVAAAEPGDAARNVAAANAVLAGIAASDVICCVRLNKRHRGQDHQGAIALLGTVQPNGQTLAAFLATILSVKDTSYYGETFIGDAKLKATMRAAARLVDAAELVISRMSTV